MRKIIWTVGALMLTACSALANPHVSTTSVPSGQVNSAYSVTLHAYGGQRPYLWTLTGGSLPLGLNLSSGGVISGTPSVAGTSNFTVTVTDNANKQASAVYALIINPAPLVLGCPGTVDPVTGFCNLAAGQVGVPYSVTLPVTGGVPPYTFSLLSGSLPRGLTLAFAEAKQRLFLRDLARLNE